MSKTFRPWKIDEPLLLPPVVQEFVAKDHLARLERTEAMMTVGSRRYPRSPGDSGGARGLGLDPWPQRSDGPSFDGR
jgi:hypothetical protein